MSKRADEIANLITMSDGRVHALALATILASIEERLPAVVSPAQAATGLVERQAPPYQHGERRTVAGERPAGEAKCARCGYPVNPTGSERTHRLCDCPKPEAPSAGADQTKCCPSCGSTDPRFCSDREYDKGDVEPCSDDFHAASAGADQQGAVGEVATEHDLKQAGSERYPPHSEECCCKVCLGIPDGGPTVTMQLPVPVDREMLGRVVREGWVKWAKSQPNPKPSWLVPWSELGEFDKEADRRIGDEVHAYLAAKQWSGRVIECAVESALARQAEAHARERARLEELAQFNHGRAVHAEEYAQRRDKEIAELKAKLEKAEKS